MDIDNTLAVKNDFLLKGSGCQDQFSTNLSSGIWGLGFGLALRLECCIVRIALPEGWEG